MSDGEEGRSQADTGGQEPQPLSATRPEAPSDSGRTPARGGAMTFGIFLVVLGVALTAGRYIPGLHILNAWPLIIIVLGVVRVFRSRDAYGIVDGMTTVLVGGILLANTLGRLPWGVWISILSLWPLLLIAAGIAIIGRAVSMSWLRVVGQLVIVSGLVYGALVMPSGSFAFPLYVTSLDQGSMESFYSEATQTGDETTATRGTAEVTWGAAEVTVGDGSGIASVRGSAPRNAQPTFSATTEGGRATVSVSAAAGGGAGPGGRFDVALGRDLRWESVALRLAASTANLDLRRLEVDRIVLDTGASNSTLVIGRRARSVAVRVNAGVANVKLRVPADASVTLLAQGPMTTNLPGTFSRAGGNLFDERWEAKPAAASVQIDVVVAGGLMNLEVETY